MANAPMKPLQVGLLGMGTVGRGTWTVLRRNEEEIARRAGRPIRITWIATRTLDRAREATRGARGVNLTNDAEVVIAHPDIDIVVELIGGIEPAQTFMLQAIAQRQARRHREQGAARGARQRDLRRRAEGRRDGRVRRRGRRRHSDHQGAARGPDRQSNRVDRRDHQRHEQLHPVGDARERRDVRRPRSPTRRSAATPRPIRRSTSRASTPRTS